MDNADSWIQQLNLTGHPEGGYFRETFRSDETIPENYLPARYDGDRQFVTQILFLLKANEFSSFHRLSSDETWHFIYGTPLQLSEITPAGNIISTILGHDIFNGNQLQYTVHRENWFAAKPVENSGFSLCACSVAPGFDFSDFELAPREKLIKLFPQHKNLLLQLTR